MSNSPTSPTSSRSKKDPLLYALGLDTRTRNLRRPTTTSSSDFWYITPTRWQNYVNESLDPAKQKVALNTLRKFDQAGRIMETELGTVANYPCSWCSRESSKVECKVYADGRDRACAYCKRMGKAGCTASLVPPPLSLEERVELLDEQRIKSEEALVEMESRLLDAEQTIREQQVLMREMDERFRDWMRQVTEKFGSDVQAMANFRSFDGR